MLPSRVPHKARNKGKGHKSVTLTGQSIRVTLLWPLPLFRALYRTRESRVPHKARNVCCDLVKFRWLLWMTDIPVLGVGRYPSLCPVVLLCPHRRFPWCLLPSRRSLSHAERSCKGTAPTSRIKHKISVNVLRGRKSVSIKKKRGRKRPSEN